MVSAFSGSYFPIKVMGKGIFLTVSLILPLTYIYDSSRAILINQIPLFSLQTEFLIILAAMVGFPIFGSFVFMKVERKCRELGILGTH
jgi:ABC-2 type transport system permease protein